MANSLPQWIKDTKYGFCAVCGATDDLQYHHWKPLSLGGTDTPDNIVVLCSRHHQEIHEQRGEIKHNYLVKNGIARARENGVKVGKKSAGYEKVMRLIAERSTQFNADTLITEHEIMTAAGVKEVCYAKCKRMLLDAMERLEWPFSWPRPRQVRKHPLYDHVIKKMRGSAV